LGIPTDRKKDLEGFRAPCSTTSAATMKRFCSSRKRTTSTRQPVAVPIQVYAAGNVALVRFNLNGAIGSRSKAGRSAAPGSSVGWWHGFFTLPRLARKRQRISIEALDASERTLMQKEVSFLTGGAS